MAADLHRLVLFRSWLTDSLLAYLFWVLRVESTPPSYYPRRLKDRPEVLHTLWRRLHVRSRPDRDEGFGRLLSAGESGGDASYEPRRRAEDPEGLARGTPLTVDEETATRYTRAVITGEPGAGKTWLLRRIAHRTAYEALITLGVKRATTVHGVVWPIRVRLPELAHSPDTPIETLLARDVVRSARLGFETARRYVQETVEHGGAGDLADLARALCTVAPEVSPRLTAFITNAVAQGKAIVLLDGWDEVPESSRPELERRLRDIAREHPTTRLIVTTRDGGGFRPAILEPPGRLVDPVADLELLSLDRDQVDQFCDEWFKDFLSPCEAGVEPRQPAVELKRVLDHHSPMGELARNPLMLNFMARLAERSADIPTRRVQLYARVLHGILSEWSVEDEKPTDASVRIEAGVALEDHVALLAEIACKLVEAGQLNEFSERDICDLVEARRGHLFEPDRAIRRMSSNDTLALWKGTGLLVPIGSGTVAFLHRTFQEYLAGVALVSPAVMQAGATTEQRDTGVARSVSRVAPHLEGTDEHRAIWEEPIRLGLAHLGLIAKEPDACSAVVLAIVARAPGPPGRAVAAMGDAVAEISSALQRAGASSAAQGVTVQCRDEVVAAALACMGGELHTLAATIPSLLSMGNAARAPEPAGFQRLLTHVIRWTSPKPPAHHRPGVCVNERVACGNALARLGDQRFHGSTSDVPRAASEVIWGLPVDDRLGFLPVEPPRDAEFYMGSDVTERDAFGDEKPRQRVRLDTLFYMSRWPVTAGQFRLFLRETKYDGAVEWARGPANHPVVSVSLLDAMKYCQWLNEEFLAERHRSHLPVALRTAIEAEPGVAWLISLPTEAEWEWAAIGPKGDKYPGGQRLTNDSANYADTGVGTTSPVGCFPLGASWCEVEELAGNVREWTRSKHWAYTAGPMESYDARRDGLEGVEPYVLRGGSFKSSPKYLRAACRHVSGLAVGSRLVDCGFRIVLRPFRPLRS